MAPDTKCAEEITKVFLITNNAVLQSVHALTFNVQKKIQMARQDILVYHPEMEQVLSGAGQLPLAHPSA